MWVTILTLSVCALLATGSSVHARIVIEDSPLTSNETLATVPLIGYRAFPTQALVKLSESKGWVLDTSMLYATAASDPAFLRKAGTPSSEVKYLPVGDVLKYYKENTSSRSIPMQCDGLSSYSEIKYGSQLNAPSGSQDSATTRKVSGGFQFPCASPKSLAVEVNDSAYLKRDVTFDANFVRLAAANDVLGHTDLKAPDLVRAQPIANSGAYGIVMDAHFAHAMTSVYSALDTISGSDVTVEQATYFSHISKIAWQEAKLPEVTVVRLVDVKLGTPYIFTAAEKELKVEKSLLRKNDVYWLQLAVNPQADLSKTLRQLSLLVSLETRGAEALNLAPLKFGPEEEQRVKLNSPNVKVGAEGVEVEIGSFYGQEIAYKSIKPTIEGTGLQDPNFKWTLSDESLHMSAERLIAIIKVPKGTRKLQFGMMLLAHLKHGWLPVQDDTATSERILQELELPRQ